MVPPASGVQWVQPTLPFSSASLTFWDLQKDYLDIAGRFSWTTMRGTNLKVAHVDERWVPFLWCRCLPLMKQVLTIPLPSTSVIQGTSQSKSSQFLAYQIASFEHGHTPSLCANGRSHLQTLLNVYEKKQTGLKGHEQVIGGGTFWSLAGTMALPSAVPGLNRYHAPNQRIYRLGRSLPSSNNLCKLFMVLK